MAVRQYIGARYVPAFMGEYSNEMAYEPLSVVLYNNSSYTSKKTVPAGTLPTNTEYWALTGNFNSQVEEYRQETAVLSAKVGTPFWKNVKDYGAVGDGVTDDTEKIQYAINVCSASGDILFFPKGTYSVSSLYAKDGLHMLGSGILSTVIHFNGGQFFGDSTNDNRFDGGVIEELTIEGDGVTATQNGFNMVMITSYIRNVLAKNFLDTAFYLPKAGTSYYQTYVDTVGERHGLTRCSALNCGRGFYLYTEDSMYSQLLGARCSTLMEAYGCTISDVHLWGYTEVGLHLDGSVWASNIQVEGALSATPNANILFSGSDVTVSNLRIWNVNTNTNLFWCASCSDYTISNLSIGKRGELNGTDVTEAQNYLHGFGGTATNFYVDGAVNDAYETGNFAAGNTGIVSAVCAKNSISGCITSGTTIKIFTTETV